MIKAGLKERVKSDKERGVTVRVYGWCFTPSPPIRLTQVAHGERKQEAAQLARQEENRNVVPNWMTGVRQEKSTLTTTIAAGGRGSRRDVAERKSTARKEGMQTAGD